MALVRPIDKNEFYKLVKQYIIHHHPALLHLLSSKSFKEANLVIKGFNSCLSVLVEGSVNENEVRELLVKEAVKHILNPNEKG